jgi:DNA polymerase-3 subunit epsilon
MMILDRPLAFVDLETSGGTATRDRITEIAIITFDGVNTSSWSTLVNPETRIPIQIQQITGISNDMVSDAPSFEDIAAEVYSRLENHLFIAHNVRFDYGFLKNEFKRVGIDFRSPLLCTVKLSRKLYPEYARHNLDSLIERHGLVVENRHRAMADTKAIFDFWQLVHRTFPTERITSVLKELTGRPSLPPHIDSNIIDELPEGHGVYLFYGENELPIYVGKSKNLKQRVLTHFSGDHASAKEMSISQQVRRIDWIECAGEVDSLLTESRLVKELQPTINRQLRRNRDFCSWHLVDQGHGLWQPELLYTSDLDLGRQEYLYGLFKSAKEAKDTLINLVKQEGLCAVTLGLEKGALGKPCFARQLKKCRGACVGEESHMQHSMRTMEVLSQLKLKAWTFDGPALLAEGDLWHVIDAWCYLGTARSEEDVWELLEHGTPRFDKDTYRILVKHVKKMRPLSAKQTRITKNTTKLKSSKANTSKQVLLQTVNTF